MITNLTHPGILVATTLGPGESITVMLQPGNAFLVHQFSSSYQSSGEPVGLAININGHAFYVAEVAPPAFGDTQLTFPVDYPLTAGDTFEVIETSGNAGVQLDVIAWGTWMGVD